MRAWPMFERMLLIAAAIMVAAWLAFLMAWHLRWNAMQRTIADIVPRPGVAIPAMPATDAAVWNDFLAWGARTDADDVYACAGVADWVRGDAAPPPAQVERMRARIDAYLHDWDALLARGLHPGLVSVPGWPDRYRQARIQVTRAAWAWEFRARVDGDPTAALAGMARMESAITPMGFRFFYLLCHLDHCRDELCLVAALDGRLTAPARAAWRGRPDRTAMLLPALEFSRRVEIPRQHCAMFAMDPLTFWHSLLPQTSWSEGWYVITLWWSTSDHLSHTLKLLDDDETAFVTDASSEDEYRSQVLAGAAEHRNCLLADDIITLRRASGTMPAAASGDWSGGADRLTLTYERIDNDRFAIRIDPAAPVPPHLQDIAGVATQQAPAIAHHGQRVSEDLQPGLMVDFVGK